MMHVLETTVQYHLNFNLLNYKTIYCGFKNKTKLEWLWITLGLTITLNRHYLTITLINILNENFNNYFNFNIELFKCKKYIIKKIEVVLIILKPVTIINPVQ